MIDFEQLVLGPCMEAFANPVAITPIKSQPMVGPYVARGVIDVAAVDLVTEDGGSFSSRTIKLGIKFGDYTILPKQGDWVTVAASDMPLGYWQGEIKTDAQIDFVIDDFRPDGQGGASVILKRRVDKNLK